MTVETADADASARVLMPTPLQGRLAPEVDGQARKQRVHAVLAEDTQLATGICRVCGDGHMSRVEKRG